MKTLLLAVGIFLVLGASAFAQPDRDGTLPAGRQCEEKLVFVTGSHIPQRVKLRPVGTNTFSPVRIIDRHEIDGTGRLTTPGALVNEPAIRIIGR